MTVDGDLDIRRQEAASWFARLSQRRVSTDDVKAFSAWRRNPDNARAYERVESVWNATNTLAGDPDISDLTAEAMGKASSPVRARALVSRLWTPLGGVALAAVAVVAAGALWAVNRPLDYATAVGEQRTVRLDDGSRVTLDTGSRIQVRLRDDRRSVALLSGQAFFDVTGDPARPFVVSAGDTDVTAIGTRFDVRRMGDGARVTLVEGRVSVRETAQGDAGWSLNPGQQVVTAAPRPAVATVDIAQETSWTTGRLIFRATPIRAAVAEINRYSDEKIDLRASHIADIPVSGVFDTGDTDGFIAALQDLYSVKAERRPDGTVILSGPPA
ncbi:FecR family protein [Brevundimonas sp. AJA228-03]|uniref:FecR family protein n=1 Tax=Brevundimonas sp. AJA228-03 TaxID=2752515 RepID=UPI001AE0B25D|nr:FecR family protein [Brevundimonas sp. AJA228-03]QTN20878.1 FecR family protein [Brevundimonas sp. AJA228-03]